MKILAIIVTFNPNISELSLTIDDIISFGLDVCIVDNSDITSNINFSMLNTKASIIRNYSNLGIAKAQNIAVKSNLKYYDCFLFLDQDSKLSRNFLMNSKDFIENKEIFIQVPIVQNKFTYDIYPAININKYGFPKQVDTDINQKFQRIDVGISSGTLVKSNVFESNIFFREDLFIDFVDIEWFLKCKKNGFYTYQNNSINLYHQIGGEERVFLGKRVLVHNEIRIYYKTRNVFLLFRDDLNIIYVTYQLLSSLVLNFINVLFVRNKFLGLKMYFKAILHGLINKGGKIQ